MPTARMTVMTHAIGNLAQNGCAGGTVVGGGLVSIVVMVGATVMVPVGVCVTFPPVVFPEPPAGVVVTFIVVGTVVGLVVVAT